MKDVKMVEQMDKTCDNMSNPFDEDWVKKECLNNIKLIEEEIEFLKAQSIITQYILTANTDDYPSYVLEAVQTVNNSIEKRIKKFEQVLTDEKAKYALLISERGE